MPSRPPSTRPRLPIPRTARDMQPHAGRAASFLKAFANEQRLMILCHLVPGPLSVGELNERLPLSQSALSQHLGVLRESGVVASRRESQTIIYSLPSGVSTRIIELLHETFCSGVRNNGRSQS